MHEQNYINCTIKCWFKQYSRLMHKMSYVNSELFKRKKIILKNNVIGYTPVTSVVQEMCPSLTFIYDTCSYFPLENAELILIPNFLGINNMLFTECQLFL